MGVSSQVSTDRTDLSYLVETSTDLVTWGELKQSAIAADGLMGRAPVTYPALEALLGSGDSTLFLRLRVTLTRPAD